MKVLGKAAAAALAAAFAVWLLPPYPQYFAARIATLVIVTVALNILAGNAGLVSLATPAFMGISAFAMVIQMQLWNIPFPVAAAIGIALSYVVGWVLGLISLRLEGFYLGLVTIGLLISFQVFLLRGGKLTGAGYGFVVPAVDIFGYEPDPTTWALVAVALSAATVVAAHTLVSSRVGRTWSMIRHNELVPELFGINLLRAKTSAFATTSALAGFGGCVYAFVQTNVSPEQFDVKAAIDQFAYMIVGGAGSVAGSVLGPLVMETAPELLRGLGNKRQLFFAFVLLLILAVAPRGLAGAIETAWDRFRPAAWRPRPLVPSRPAAAGARPPATAPMGTSVALEFAGVSLQYGGVLALDRLSFSVVEGAFHGLIGANGAGKTTAINALTAVAPISAGRVLFKAELLIETGRGIRRHRLVGRGIVRTFQTPLFDARMSALENVSFGRYHRMPIGVAGATWNSLATRSQDRETRDLALQTLGYVGFDGDASAPASTLTFANLRRMELARALVSEPDLLLLDEPTSGLESHLAHEIVARLKALQRSRERPLTIVLVEHNVPLVFEFADRVTAMDRGAALLTASPDSVRADERVRAAYLGESMPPAPAPAGSAARA